MMDLYVQTLDIDAGKPIALLTDDDAAELGVHPGDRIEITHNGLTQIGIVDIVQGDFMFNGRIVLFDQLRKELKVSGKELVQVLPAPKPISVEFIRKRLDGGKLNEAEIRNIILDITNDRLSDPELMAFTAAVYTRHFSMTEAAWMTDAMVQTGDVLHFDDKIILDKHSIGGVPGNRVTMVLVPILAALGYKVPKTSSRAITSPSGTADTMEVLAKVNFRVEEIEEMVENIGGCIVWGGGINLAPADDRIIRVRRSLSIDPEAQVLASVMAKKKSAGATHVVIDLPLGPEAKLNSKATAERWGRQFVELGKRIGVSVNYQITAGRQPIGNGVGPILEARDVLMALDGEGPKDLVDKTLVLSSTLLKMIKVKDGAKKAKECLDDGRALEKMREIIKAQGGNPNIKPGDLATDKYAKEYCSKNVGRVRSISNHAVSAIAKVAGCPKNKGAGVYLHKKVNERVAKGEALFTVYTQNETKLGYVEDAVKRLYPYTIK